MARDCRKCDGTGKVECPKCDGAGRIGGNRCTRCGDGGFESDVVNLLTLGIFSIIEDAAPGAGKIDCSCCNGTGKHDD